METFSALLAICAGNSPVIGEFSAQRPVTWSFHVLYDLCLNKRLSKQTWVWWFDTPSCPIWRHCNVSNLIYITCNSWVILFFRSLLWHLIKLVRINYCFGLTGVFCYSCRVLSKKLLMTFSLCGRTSHSISYGVLCVWDQIMVWKRKCRTQNICSSSFERHRPKSSDRVLQTPTGSNLGYKNFEVW